MASQVFEFVVTELKHKIVWEAKDIPLNGTNEVPCFYINKVQLNQCPISPYVPESIGSIVQYVRGEPMLHIYPS
jgi:hypothetical protein